MCICVVRVLNMPATDLGSPAYRKIDMEVSIAAVVATLIVVIIVVIFHVIIASF